MKVEVDILIQQFNDEFVETFEFEQGDEYIELAKKIVEHRNLRVQSQTGKQKALKVTMIRDGDEEKKPSDMSHEELTIASNPIRLGDYL